MGLAYSLRNKSLVEKRSAASKNKTVAYRRSIAGAKACNWLNWPAIAASAIAVNGTEYNFRLTVTDIGGNTATVFGSRST